MTDPPPRASAAKRVEWANERAWDFAEGLLSRDDAQLVWNYLIGWADLASSDDRATYLAMAKHVQTLIRARDDE